MSHLITSQLVEAQCPRKAFFLLRGTPEPQPHDYEIAIAERAAKKQAAYSGKPVILSSGNLQAIQPHHPLIGLENR